MSLLPRTSDVVVIGAGVIGASIAYHLSLRNIGVLLLDKGDLGAGTSGACSGHIFLQSKRPGAHLKLAMIGQKRFRTLKEELDFDIEYQNHGGMIVIEKETELEGMHHLLEDQKTMGLPVSLLGKDQAREMEPALSKEIAAATYCPLDGQVNPLRLTLAFIKAARRMGAKVFARREVTGIGLRGARIGPLRTTEGEIEAKTIVNAAGVSASQIGRMVNLDIPIKPRRGQILVTEAVPPTLRCPLLSSSYITKKFESAASSAEEAGVSIEQTSNGNFLLGSTREFVGLDVRTTWEGMRGIASRTAKIVPGLRNMHIIRAFSGLRPHTPDGLPILGRVKGLDGFIMAAGHEGDGIALSPATGQLIAELIDAGSTTMDLADFGLERFLQGVEA